MKIYLSGGMSGDWQDFVPVIEGAKYFDPRTDTSKYITMQSFVKNDVDQVKESDLVFLYMEKSNPSGYGAIWECAVAVENSIPIIAVWEKDYVDPFIACNALYLYNTFDSGLERLGKYIAANLKE